jgi:DMSO/TMAO reductase YedYZ heme-binding membrane subunit
LINKAISLSAVGLLALSYLIRRWRWLRPAHPVRTLAVIQFCGLGGFWLVGVHATLSLAILSPDYFPKFFEDRKLSFAGELSMLCGVVALWCYVLPVMATLPQTRQALGAHRWRRYQQLGYAGLVLVIVHLAFMGFPQWFSPSEWPGYMPPITMLGAALALAPLVVRLLASRRK